MYLINYLGGPTTPFERTHIFRVEFQIVLSRRVVGNFVETISNEFH